MLAYGCSLLGQHKSLSLHLSLAHLDIYIQAYKQQGILSFHHGLHRFQDNPCTDHRSAPLLDKLNLGIDVRMLYKHTMHVLKYACIYVYAFTHVCCVRSV